MHYKDIFNINSEESFLQCAMEVYEFQYANNPVYKQWCDLSKGTKKPIRNLQDIPFLPIHFFKSRSVFTSAAGEAQIIFSSSGTGSQVTSRHYVKDPGIYEKSFSEAFKLFYGDPSEYCILALLPNYLEREGSSLVYMFKKLIEDSRHPMSGFYIHELQTLKEHLKILHKKNQKTLLIGISYALMDLAELQPELPEKCIVMETGGMKGKRKEMLKTELHSFLKTAFKVNEIHSEYGMTELLSQAYSQKSEKFLAPPWLKFLIRDISDPLSYVKQGKTGGINVIDLANIHSCSFIATADLGKLHGSELELMGRYDHSDVRGCNLMMDL